MSKTNARTRKPAGGGRPEDGLPFARVVAGIRSLRAASRRLAIMPELYLAVLGTIVVFGLAGHGGGVAPGHGGSLPGASVSLVDFNPSGAGKQILTAFAIFIAVIAIFAAVGRFARGATMQGFGVLLAGGILFAIAAAPESLKSFGQWVLKQFGVG